MSDIEWTEKTWNPVRGCSRVSPGCDNCYAMRQAHRFNTPPVSDPSGDVTLNKAPGPYYRLTTKRKGKIDWSGVARFVPEMLEKPLRTRVPTTWFVNSMSDLFHASITDEQIAAVFGVMAACPQHTFQVLTKRAERLPEFEKWIRRHCNDEEGLCPPAVVGYFARLAGTPITGDRDLAKLLTNVSWPLPNVWLGVSAEDQKRADERIPHLLATPAAIRFVSAEPLIGPIDLSLYVLSRCTDCTAEMDPEDDECTGQAVSRIGTVLPYPCPGRNRTTLDWVIVGGESGHGARDCDVAWIRSITEQCGAAFVPVFVKQLGASSFRSDWDDIPADMSAAEIARLTELVRIKHRKGADMAEWPEDLRVRQMPAVRS